MTSMFDPGFTTPEMMQIWSASSRAASLLQFEAALALSLADAGVAPREQAEAVAGACLQPLKDPEAIWASTWETGTPLIALVEEINRRLGDEEQRRWVHHGATTQDAIDTMQMMQAAKGLDLLEASLTRIAARTYDLMQIHRRQPQMGRTFLQSARPTTFGMRLGWWLEATLTHIEDMRATRSGLAVQLGGAVGNRTEFGHRSQEVVDALARRLGLESTALAWQTDRSRIWKLVAAIEQPVRTLAKVAMDVALLAQTDSAEVTVREGASSSMADKRNPLDSIRALAAADACRGVAAIITQSRPHELDRGVGSWHAEWFALPLVFQTAAAVFQSVERLLESLEVIPETMDSRVPSETPPDETAMADQIESVISRYQQVIGKR